MRREAAAVRSRRLRGRSPRPDGSRPGFRRRGARPWPTLPRHRPCASPTVRRSARRFCDRDRGSTGAGRYAPVRGGGASWGIGCQGYLTPARRRSTLSSAPFLVDRGVAKLSHPHEARLSGAAARRARLAHRRHVSSPTPARPAPPPPWRLANLLNTRPRDRNYGTDRQQVGLRRALGTATATPAESRHPPPRALFPAPPREGFSMSYRPELPLLPSSRAWRWRSSVTGTSFPHWSATSSNPPRIEEESSDSRRTTSTSSPPSSPLPEICSTAHFRRAKEDQDRRGLRACQSEISQRKAIAPGKLLGDGADFQLKVHPTGRSSSRISILDGPRPTRRS